MFTFPLSNHIFVAWLNFGLVEFILNMPIWLSVKAVLEHFKESSFCCRLNIHFRAPIQLNCQKLVSYNAHLIHKRNNSFFIVLIDLS